STHGSAGWDAASASALPRLRTQPLPLWSEASHGSARAQCLGSTGSGPPSGPRSCPGSPSYPGRFASCGDGELFRGDPGAAGDQRRTGLVQEVVAAVLHPLMKAGESQLCLAPGFRPLGLAAQDLLRPSEALLGFGQVPRVVDRERLPASGDHGGERLRAPVETVLLGAPFADRSTREGDRGVPPSVPPPDLAGFRYAIVSVPA